MNDIQLLEKLKKRSRSSLEAAIRRYSSYVSTVIYNTAGSSLSKEDIEEVAQDVFLALWNNAENIRGESITAYIGRTAHNMALNKLRTLRPALPISDTLPSEDGNPEAELEVKEFSRLLYEEIVGLGPPDSEIFIRYYYNNEKIREISADMEMNASTIKSRLRRGKERLKQILSGKGGLI